MRAVLDANVLISAILSPRGSPAGLLRAWQAGEFEPVHSVDPGDDYLLALAAVERAVLVSGDADLTSLRGQVPVRTAAELPAGLRSLDG